MANEFHTPQKAILSQQQLDEFQGSGTYNKIIQYIETLNNAIAGLTLNDECLESEVFNSDKSP
jgi:serine/threonine-protein phosphatase 2A activator